MPDYIIEVKTKSLYGPFTYPNPSKLKEDILAGALPLTPDNAISIEQLVSLNIKEAK